MRVLVRILTLHQLNSLKHVKSVEQPCVARPHLISSCMRRTALSTASLFSHVYSIALILWMRQGNAIFQRSGHHCRTHNAGCFFVYLIGPKSAQGSIVSSSRSIRRSTGGVPKKKSSSLVQVCLQFRFHSLDESYIPCMFPIAPHLTSGFIASCLHCLTRLILLYFTSIYIHVDMYVM